MNKKRWLAVSLAIFVIGIIIFLFLKNDAKNSKVENEKTTQQSSNNNQQFDKTKYSIDEPGSIWWIVNKNRALPEGYEPSDLVVPEIKLRLNEDAEQMKISEQINKDLNDMFNQAKNEGVILVFGSGFRSYELQKQFYESYVAQDGQEAADRYSAKPGTSEHQTGLSFDATNVDENCHLEICFAETPEGKWIKENSYKYGFIVRYPDGKENITGYQYEPWHLRYVGKELASELNKTGQTMEEFFGLN